MLETGLDTRGSEAFDAAPFFSAAHVSLLKDIISQNTSVRKRHSEYMVNRKKKFVILLKHELETLCIWENSSHAHPPDKLCG